MKIDNRILHNDNGTFVDASKPLNEFGDDGETYVLPFIAAEDALYIGGTLPFNHRYFDVKVPNDTSCTISIALWNGESFKPVVETRDETVLIDVPLARSGFISWTPDRNEAWERDDSENIPDFAALNSKIYGLYWAKITWSDDLDAATELKSVMHKFSDDSLLAKLYPDLVKASVLAAFGASKTTWNDQHFLAAEAIIRELRSDDRIISADQILETDPFSEASAHLVALRIYNAFGDDYIDNKARAYEDFKAAMKSATRSLDQNKDARLTLEEQFPTVGIFRR